MPKAKKKFIDRKKAVTFNLVHRSQKDPLAADETAPQRVLVPVNANIPARKEKDPDLTPEQRREEQIKYGIYFDDDYNYLQHLKDTREVTLVVQPKTTHKKKEKSSEPNQDDEDEEEKPKIKSKLNLPSSVFASEVEEEIGLLNKGAPQGLCLDLDPDVVAALDEDFDFEDPENELEDNFIELAMGDGEDEDDYEGESDDDGDDDSERAFASDADMDSDDESADSQDRGRMPVWDAADHDKEDTKSRFSQYSMSSSVIKRNQGLTLLDQRFEKMFADYDDTELGALDLDEIEGFMPESHRMMLQAAEEFEESRRKVLLDKEKEIARMRRLQEIEEESEDEIETVEVDPKEKWDCETILSTYSNLYNHPKIIEEPKDWRPPTTPVIATPRSSTSNAGSASSSRRVRRPVRRRLTKEQIYITLGNQDSGSELEEDEGEEGNEDDLHNSFDDVHRLRQVARALESLAVNDEGDDQVLNEIDDGHFNWCSDFQTFTGQEESYTRDPGPNIETQDGLDIFLHIWDEDILKMIVEETNRYAWLYIAGLTEHGGDVPKNLDSWYETTVPEMYRYLGILMFMAIIPLGTIKEYWSTGILEIPGFRTLMSRNRYQMLSRFIHFVDNQFIPHDVRSYSRKIAKIEPILKHCNTKFQSIYTPGRELSLDESLLLWKGHLSWIQCIRSKAARFGIKTFELCEASTGYTLRTLIYAGKNSSMHEGSIQGFTSPTAKVVLKLMDGYLDVGHLLVMDNWYNRLPLTRYLKQRNTDTVGTLNRRRQHVPDIIKQANDRRMSAGERISTHCGDIAITSWKDVKLVTVMSTYHCDDMGAGRRAGQERDKPIAVIDYNKYMGGVDLKDQKLSMYLLERKRGIKWYIKVFRRLLNTSLLNAYIIYCKNPMFRVLTHRQFRMQVAEGLCKRFPRENLSRPLPPAVSCTRLNQTLQHFPVETPILTGVRRSKRRCAYCASRKVRTQVTIMCGDCNVGLCIGQCWHKYHTGGAVSL